MKKYYVEYKQKGKWNLSYPIWHFWKFYLNYEGAYRQYLDFKELEPNVKVRIRLKQSEVGK